MNPWDILGIPPTADKSIIKKAYAKKIKQYHPEDDPDGFMRVRLAYEEALKRAENMSKQTVPNIQFDEEDLSEDEENEEDNEDEDNEDMVDSESINQNEQHTRYSKSIDIPPEEFESEKKIKKKIHLKKIDIPPEKFEDEKKIKQRNHLKKIDIPPEEPESEIEIKQKFPLKSIDIPPENDEDFSESQEETTYEDMHHLYRDVFRRRDVKEWQKLMMGLTMDEYQQFQEEAVYFFNENCHLPQEVWSYLENEFSLSTHPDFQWADFLHYDFGLHFDFLDPNMNCDYERYAEKRFSAFEAFREMNYKSAVKKALQAEGIYQGDPVLYRILGISYYKTGSFDKAVEALGKALTDTEHDLDVLVIRGNTFLKKNDTKLAKDDFERALAIDGESLDARKGIIICLKQSGKFGEANRQKDALYKTYPNDVELDLILYANSKNEGSKLTGEAKGLTKTRIFLILVIVTALIVKFPNYYMLAILAGVFLLFWFRRRKS